jgi:transposase InsO family protein
LLTDSGLIAFGARQGLVAATMELIKRVRASDPARRGFSRHKNVSGRFPSDKMGLALGTSAYHTEGLGLLGYELTPEVIEFWEEPGVELKFSYLDGRGRRRSGRFHPDHLVLEDGGVFLDEWKTEEQLINDASRMPGRYIRDETGWRCPSAEESAARLGLVFRLRTPGTVPSDVRLNGRFMRDYYLDETPVPDELVTKVLRAVREDEGLTLATLFLREPAASADDVYRLIARGVIYVDLAHHRLAETFYVPVFSSRVVSAAATAADESGVRRGAIMPALVVRLDPGETIRKNGSLWTVIELTETQVTFRAVDGAMLPLSLAEVEQLVASGDIRAGTYDAAADETRSRALDASPDALKEAERRFRALEAAEANRPTDVPRRTMRRWRRLFKAGVQKSGSGFDGLIPHLRGRPEGPTLNAELEKYITAAIESFHETKDAPNAVETWGQVVLACADSGLEPPSYQTVLSRINKRSFHEADVARRGEKAAYQTKDFYAYLAGDTPVHGERPWQRTHIDHTELDLVDSETGLPLGRPWITLLIDAYSRRVLAYWVSFDPPSYISLLMVMRDCVRRWNRLPAEIVADGGAEFGSEYFELLVIKHGIELLIRPGQPRFGSVIERIFGMTHTRLIHALMGNTKPTKIVRAMSADMDPKRRAVWTLAKLDELLDGFFVGVYDQLVHPALGASPQAFYEARLAQTGLREMRLIANDEAFFRSTLPTTDKGTAMVDRQKGVKINTRYYRATELRAPGLHRTQVPVLFDPMDVRHAFVYVDNRWVECWCLALRKFSQITERQIKAMSAETTQRARIHESSVTETATTVATYLGGAKGWEKTELQQKAALEAQLAAATRSSSVSGMTTSSDPIEVADLLDDKLMKESDDDVLATTQELEVYGAYD